MTGLTGLRAGRYRAKSCIVADSRFRVAVCTGAGGELRGAEYLMPTGAELFVASIKNLGATHIFTLVGDHLNEVLQVADREGLKIYDTRHESAAVHMADGWGRMTRTPVSRWSPARPGIPIRLPASPRQTLPAARFWPSAG